MDKAYVRLPTKPGQVVEITAVDATKKHFNMLPYICPVCAEKLILVENIRGYFNNPFFRHPRKQDCIIKTCPERVTDEGIASARNSRPAVPLFLYRKNDGAFSLGMALSTKLKQKLAEQQFSRFSQFQIRCGREIKAFFPMWKLQLDGGAEFIDLNCPVPKKAVFTPCLAKPRGELKLLGEALNQSFTMLDCFMATSCTGAIFRTVAAGVYEKLPVGSFITAGQKYIIIDKVTNLSKPVNNKLDTYGIEMEQLGVLDLDKTKTRYTVCEVSFKKAKDTPHYSNMAEYITEKYGVILCDKAEPWPEYKDIFSLDDDPSIQRPAVIRTKKTKNATVKPKNESTSPHRKTAVKKQTEVAPVLAKAYGTAKYQKNKFADKYKKYA